MVPQWTIEKKRDGERLEDCEIREFIGGFASGKIPDYQMAAMAMAIFFRGMDAAETATLTDAMMRSGDLLDWGACPMPTADKHSTGGIGDKISLMLAPLVAAMGVAVPMISGRGLGITGGTLDKLDSIPGYNSRLPVADFQRIVGDVGCSIIGQTARLAPADGKLYALRDVTGTVPSIPLITASIMSKKLAEGAGTLVFDVKFGRAAFMRTRADAEKLLESLVSTGRRMGRKCDAVLTPMDDPHGRAVGNALEVAEAVETLRGAGPADTRALTLDLACRMVALASPGQAGDGLRAAIEHALDSGAALGKFVRMVEAQGGDPRFVDNPALLPQPGASADVLADRKGVVAEVDAAKIGRVALELGAGRRAVTDAIDPAAGIDCLVARGEAVSKGDRLMTLHAATPALAEGLVAAARDAVSIG
ncbi:MAG: thymidine phosphorylase [Kiritimatiellae bacterium]|nr:thymidine phosphorylase [Kiritimatiellia bacterium]